MPRFGTTTERLARLRREVRGVSTAEELREYRHHLCDLDTWLRSAAPKRTRGESGGPGAFGVPSATVAGRVWTVELRTADTLWCPCPGYQHRGSCRHAEAAADLYRAERRDGAGERIKKMVELFSD